MEGVTKAALWLHCVTVWDWGREWFCFLLPLSLVFESKSLRNLWNVNPGQHSLPGECFPNMLPGSPDQPPGPLLSPPGLAALRGPEPSKTADHLRGVREGCWGAEQLELTPENFPHGEIGMCELLCMEQSWEVGTEPLAVPSHLVPMTLVKWTDCTAPRS